MATTVKKATNAKTTTKKKRISKNVGHGQCHIKTSFNNTIVTFSDDQGNVLSWASAGKWFRGSKKSTPFAAQQCVSEAVKQAKEQGLTSVDVYVKGPGNGREAAIRELQNAEIQVTMIKDVSPIAHNGCRPPKPRRI